MSITRCFCVFAAVCLFAETNQLPQQYAYYCKVVATRTFKNAAIATTPQKKKKKIIMFYRHKN